MVSNEAAERFLNAPWLSELDTSARLALLNMLEEGRAEAVRDARRQLPDDGADDR